MLYTELTKKAMKISFEAHKSQTDKNGMPYIYHPIQMVSIEENNQSIAVAVVFTGNEKIYLNCKSKKDAIELCAKIKAKVQSVE